MAEAIAIHLAALAGMRIDSDHEDASEIVAQATNRAGMKGTTHLVPAVLRKQGSIDFGAWGNCHRCAKAGEHRSAGFSARRSRRRHVCFPSREILAFEDCEIERLSAPTARSDLEEQLSHFG